MLDDDDESFAAVPELEPPAALEPGALVSLAVPAAPPTLLALVPSRALLPRPRESLPLPPAAPLPRRPEASNLSTFDKW